MGNIINNNSNINQPRILTGTDDFKTLLLNSEVFVESYEATVFQKLDFYLRQYGSSNVR